MNSPGSTLLLIAATLSSAAAIAHLVCIFVGAPAYRLMGAGEAMARSAERGSIQPALTTLLVTGVLTGFALYALGAAGLIGLLPFSQFVLPLICAIYLGRALAFPWLRSSFPDNSEMFWRVSSAICLVIGLVHVGGVYLAWPGFA